MNFKTSYVVISSNPAASYTLLTTSKDKLLAAANSSFVSFVLYTVFNWLIKACDSFVIFTAPSFLAAYSITS